MWNTGAKSEDVGLHFGIKASYVRALASSHPALFIKRHGGYKPRGTTQAPTPKRRKPVTSVWQRADPFAPKVMLYKPPELDQYELGRLPGVSMMEATGCKWPLTDNKPHAFCNADANGSWCAHHAFKLKGQGTISERQATKVKVSW